MSASREQTRRTQRAYARNAAFYDLQEWVMERVFYTRWRQRLWQKVGSGCVLEVGVGTGKNLAYHPTSAQVIAFDFVPAMLRQARHRNRQSIPLLLADAQQQPFADASFDTAVATFVFCSVPDADLGFKELQRVLRPGGRLLLLEHQQARWPWLATAMRGLNPLICNLTGVNIDRQTVNTVNRAGFEDVSVEYLDPAGIFVLVIARKLI